MSDPVQLAQADGGGGPGGGLGFFLPIAAMFLLLWALVIRPQSRQQKQHREMVAQIKKGDQVVTQGGVHGRVAGVSDDVLTVEIAERVRIRIDRSAIARRTAAADSAPAKKPGKAS